MDALNNPSTQVNVAIGVGVAGIGWIAWRLSWVYLKRIPVLTLWRCTWVTRLS